MTEEFGLRLRMTFAALLALAVLSGCVVRAAPGRFMPGSPYPAGSTVYDVSWPNCSARPPHGASWGIVGVTGGLSLHPNKCLSNEAAWFRQLSLYLNTGYPGADRARKYMSSPKHCWVAEPTCLAYNYGYAAGEYAVALAAHQNVHATTWWLDVETSNSWDDDPMVNRASIQGTLDALRREVFFARVGIYSYPAQWEIITAQWRPGLPAWAATGSTQRQAGILACKQPSFTGGPVWLGQYTEKLDRNIACPAR